MSPRKRPPKTEFLQIRLAADDRRRIEEVAARQHLDASTWARQILLRELDLFEPSKARDPGVA
jgi:hypothetical protein